MESISRRRARLEAKSRQHRLEIERLLRQLQENPSLLTIVLTAILAVVGAPLAEELMFRGILQSYLVRFFRLMMPPKGMPHQTLTIEPPEIARLRAEEEIALARAMGVQPPMDLQAVPAPQEAGGQAEPLTPPQEARRAIAAIVFAAAVFASIHPPTSIPVIFVLALALGYVYETTGSLVCAMAMHATFNFVPVLSFLVR
mgnify:CR=1 FL=1